METANNWQELKADLEAETQRVFLECPDEIKRFHYGIISHSDAGKYAKGQYFGHWTHVYAEYYSLAGAELTGIIRWASDPDRASRAHSCLTPPARMSMRAPPSEPTTVR